MWVYARGKLELYCFNSSYLVPIRNAARSRLVLRTHLTGAVVVILFRSVACPPGRTAAARSRLRATHVI
jgi:hypothetical protein